MNEFRNRDEYLKHCKLAADKISNCDPFNFYDFEEDEVTRNFIHGTALMIFFFFISFGLFLYRNRDLSAIMSDEKEMVDKYSVWKSHEKERIEN